MEGLLVLPKDIRVVAVGDMPEHMRSAIDAAHDSYAIARPNSRVASQMIDGSAWSLLQHFREPTTVVDAILRYSRDVKSQPADVFEDAFPLLESLYQTSLLVNAESDEATAIQPLYSTGSYIGEHEVVRNVQILPDTELYEVRTPDGAAAALKLVRPGAPSRVAAALQREKDALQLLRDYPSAPAVIDFGVSEGRPFLLLEWCPGTDAVLAASKARASGPYGAAHLCQRILDAYAALHLAGVRHGDVHPRNILIAPDGEVALIDFGLAAAGSLSSAPRGGSPIFFEPEFASAELAATPFPPVSDSGEQYSVAALVYMMLCSVPYCDFKPERQQVMRQIAELEPVPFGVRRCLGHASVEAVLRRALSKDPQQRWPGMAAFAAAFRAALAEDIGDAVRATTLPRTSTDEFVRSVLDRTVSPSPDLGTRGLRSPLASITYGAAGVACGLLRIATARDDGEMFARADAWAEFAAHLMNEAAAFYEPSLQITKETVGATSPYHCAAGVHAVRAMIAESRGDNAALDAAIRLFLAASAQQGAEIDLTTGTSSTVIGLSLLHDVTDAQRMLGNSLVSSMWQELGTRPHIRNSGSSQTLGIAHGWAGYLYSSMRWAKKLSLPPHTEVHDRLCQLAELVPSGRDGITWPITMSNKGQFVPGWCNGGAGFIFLWTMAYDLYCEPVFMELAERTAAGMIEQATDIPSLCCGTAGQGYALLNLYRHTHDKRWLQCTEEIVKTGVALAVEAETRRDPGLPLSLYKGDLGLAVLIDDLACPELAAMPFFEDAA